MNKVWSELNKTIQAQIKKKILMKQVLTHYLICEIS